MLFYFNRFGYMIRESQLKFLEKLQREDFHNLYMYSQLNRQLNLPPLSDLGLDKLC